MPSASRVSFNIQDLSASASNPIKGISYVIGQFLRGPVNDPSEVFTNWPQFKKRYGGYMQSWDDTLLVKRALDSGAVLRIANVAHYSDITNSATLTRSVAVNKLVKILNFSANLITGNVVNMTVNGNAIAAVTFTTSHLNTLSLLAAAIEAADTSVKCVINTQGLMYLMGSSLTLTGIAVTGGASQATITAQSLIPMSNLNLDELFEPTPKYPGADYNNLLLEILPASNGNVNYWDMKISHILEPDLNEYYSNLTIPASAGFGPNISNSHYLDSVIKSSQLLGFTYKDLSSVPANLLIPAYIKVGFYSGSQGGSVTNVDIIGDSASKTGFFAFNEYSDGGQICVISSEDPDIHIAGAAYADGREDLRYLAHLSNSNNVTATIIDRDSTLIDSPYTQFFYGGLKVTDPVSGLIKEISEMGDILGIISRSDNSVGEWASYAGPNRGEINNALGVVNNLGSPGSYTQRNLLAQRQINVVAVSNGKLQLMGNYTAQLANTALSWVDRIRTVIYIKKWLAPLLAAYIDEPYDIPTFKDIYRTVFPRFEQMIVDSALVDYRWEGDQDKKSITECTVNNAGDIENGIYQVNLFIKITPKMNEIKININVSPVGVDFNTLS